MPKFTGLGDLESGAIRAVGGRVCDVRRWSHMSAAAVAKQGVVDQEIGAHVRDMRVTRVRG